MSEPLRRLYEIPEGAVLLDEHTGERIEDLEDEAWESARILYPEDGADAVTQTQMDQWRADHRLL